jgi:hypothetical protein
MGRDSRLRRRGVVQRRPQPPGDPDYWKKRAQHFEQALLAAIASCPEMQLRVLNQDLTGMTLDAEEILGDNGERAGVLFKVLGAAKKVHVDEVRQPDGDVVLIPPIDKAADAFEGQTSALGFKIVEKRRAMGPTTIIDPDKEKQ